jgi:hypothetical protein
MTVEDQLNTNHYFIPSWLYDRKDRYEYIDRFFLASYEEHGFGEPKAFLCINDKYLKLTGLVRGKERTLKYTIRGLSNILYSQTKGMKFIQFYK